MRARIIMDAMGGDNAPGAIVGGAVLSAREYGIQVILVGDENAIRAELKKKNETAMEGKELIIVHADQVVTMEDDPFDVLRKKRNSSLCVSMKMLANGEADAFVGASNTGAMFAAAAMIVRPYKGIRRAALATVLPFPHPSVLLDCGANTVVTAEYLEQFAMMGSAYAAQVLHLEQPQVALLNNGAESHKGTPVQAEAYERLRAEKRIRFVGNVEGKDIPAGKCDVIVADGFTGNVTLKLIEGMGIFFMHSLKSVFKHNAWTKLSALMLHKPLYQIKDSFDSSSYGGSPFLGISKPVFKAHGSSDAVAIKNAVRQSLAYMEAGVSEQIRACADSYCHSAKMENEDNQQECMTDISDVQKG